MTRHCIWCGRPIAFIQGTDVKGCPIHGPDHHLQGPIGSCREEVKDWPKGTWYQLRLQEIRIKQAKGEI